MVNLNKEQSIALAVLFFIVLVCCATPLWLLKGRSDAAGELNDSRAMLARLEAAHQRAGGKAGARNQVTAAPAEAFLTAQTSGLASAQLETYLSQIVLDHGATLISSSVQPASHSDASDIVRIQANLEMSYDALQGLLYKLEAGTPYVFVDTMTVQQGNETARHASAMRVTLGLRAIWHRNPV